MASDAVPTEGMNDIKIAEDSSNNVEEDIVDPWKVVGSSAKGVDYDKLISEYS